MRVSSIMTRKTTRSLFLVIILLQMPLTWTHRGEAAEPLYQKLRTLNQQFKRFQRMTLTHLQNIAENHNISYSIDTRFQAFNQQFERISRELRSFKATTKQDLHSLKSWTRGLQKSTKKLNSSLANMTKALQESNHLSQRQIQKQKALLSGLSHEIQKQRNHIGTLESLRTRVQDGMHDLQDSLRRNQNQIVQLENQMQEIYQSSSSSKSIVLNLDPLTSNRKQQPKLSKKHRARNRLSLPGPTKQPQTDNTREKQQEFEQSTIKPTAQMNEEFLQLPLRHKIPHSQIPKEEAKICNVGSMLLFPSASSSNYVTFQKSFQTGIHELSICTWLRVDAKYVGTFFSYATENNDNMLVLYGRNSVSLGILDFVIGDPAFRELSVQNLLDGRWHHFCVLWSSIEGRFWYYSDHRLTSTGSKFQKGYEIPPGGSVVLGQEQDSVGGGFDRAEAFVGRLAGFTLWTRTLSPGEVSGLATGRGVPRGAELSLDDVYQLFGSVQHINCECLEHCM